jgi:glutamate-1-semialdehyde aminotransferase
MKRFGPLSPLPTVLEEGAAKTLCDITGWECVRWCKNGSDALEAAVRLARFLTKRKTVVTNSYHGSHSDLVAAQPGKDGGVLDECINSLVPCRSPDDILKTLSLRDDIAAVVMEPITPEIEDWKLEGIKHTCHQKGALLIFDEIVTGFRVRCGSAVSVQPDLACYGKAIANGWPLACVAGPERLMQTFGNWVFFSSTNAAENLSLAACIATLFYLKHKPRVYDFFRVATKKIVDALQGYGQGYPGRVRIFMPEAVHRHFVGFLAKKGFLVGRDFFLMAMHTRADINRLCSAIREFVELSRGSFSSFPSSGSELGDAPSCPQLEQAGGGFASFPTSDGVEESSPSSTPP